MQKLFILSFSLILLFSWEAFQFSAFAQENPTKKLEIKQFQRKALNIGDQVPDFKAPQPNGEELSLEEAKGKYTLIEFWASWCGPCRIENPNLVKVYQKHHEKGFNIIGVSLDRNQVAWEKAIEKDNLNWPHVSNLKFWQDPIARLFSVTFIPQNYLIDEEGKIVAKNLRAISLDKKLNELLKN